MLKKICKAKRCNALCDYLVGYCDEHIGLKVVAERERQREVDKHRGSQRDRGYTRTWEKKRVVYLKVNPLCVECKKQGKYIPANEVHHIKALADGGTHEHSNLMALCKSCHSGITAKAGFKRH